jgi:hypothetical protein
MTMDAPVQPKHEIADVYRALMVMRADFDLLGHMMNECKDLDEIKRMVQLKVDDSVILMTQVSKVRSRFSGFEMLGMVAPVPDAFLPGPTDTELSENEAAMHRSLNAIALEVPASVAQHLRDAVLTCVDGYRKRLAEASKP